MFLSALNIKYAVNGQLITSEKIANNNFASEVVFNSKFAKTNIVYFAFKGKKVDGHSFIVDVIKKGCKIIVSEKDFDQEIIKYANKEKVSLIKVKSSIIALQDLATYWISIVNIKVIGITGSCGKTTTKNLIYSVLKTKYKCCVTELNYNNEIGLPVTVCKSNIDDEVLILEMGMDGLGQIDLLCKIAKPIIGIITNIGECHIEILGSKDNIARAKCELAQNVAANNGTMVVPAFDPYLDFIIETTKKINENTKFSLYGLNCDKDNYRYPKVWAENIIFDKFVFPEFDICFKNEFEKVERSKCKLNLQGKHNIKNALGACTIGLHFGISIKNCAKALEKCHYEVGRQQLIKSEKFGFDIINDAYNASPQSMGAAIDMFNKFQTDKNKVLVLGDMAELGSISIKKHLYIGKILTKCSFYNLICIGKYSKFIYESAINNGIKKSKVFYHENNKEAYNFIKKNYDEKFIILFKASNCMKFYDLIDKLQ